MMKITLMGDIMLGELLETYGRGLRKAIDRRHIDPLAAAGPVLAKADLNIANLECVLSDHSRHAPPFSNILIAPERYVDLLRKNHINAVTLANNHALDHGLVALERCVRVLRDQEILVFGYTPGTWFQEEPVVFAHSGQRVGLLGYNIANFPPSDRERVISDIESAIHNARSSVDVLVASIHWGEEYTNIPPGYVLDYGLRLLEAGVDIIHGHHSHQIQGVAEVNGKLLAPSLGNFVFDQLIPDNRVTGLLSVNIAGSAMSHDFTAFYINDDYQPEPSPRHQDYLEELCEGLRSLVVDGYDDVAEAAITARVASGHGANRRRMRLMMLSHFWDYLPHLRRIQEYRRFPGQTFSVIRDLETLRHVASNSKP